MQDLILEIKTLQNQLTAMNKYYAQALTKTLITREEILELKVLMERIKEEPTKTKAMRKIIIKTNGNKKKNVRCKK